MRRLFGIITLNNMKKDYNKPVVDACLLERAIMQDPIGNTSDNSKGQVTDKAPQRSKLYV